MPIRPLQARHRGRLEQHLLALGERDRYLRFGYPATDTHIRAFVAGLNFERDEFFGIYDSRLELVGTAHLAFADLGTQPGGPWMAEFAVSVARSARGRGLGGRLFDHAIERARSRGLERLFIHALSENTAMLRIARRTGAAVEHHGSESEAWLQLPQADPSTHWRLRLGDHAAAANYQWKLQRRVGRRLLAGLVTLRRLMMGSARHIASQ